MTTLEKIIFVLENTSSEGAGLLISNCDQMIEIQNIEDRLWKSESVYTTKSKEAAMKAAMIVAINNGTI